MEWGAKAAVRKGLSIAFSGWRGAGNVVLGSAFHLLLQILIHLPLSWEPALLGLHPQTALPGASDWIWPMRRPWQEIRGKEDKEAGLFISWSFLCEAVKGSSVSPWSPQFLLQTAAPGDALSPGSPTSSNHPSPPPVGIPALGSRVILGYFLSTALQKALL